ncbi:MAG: hypothetical protein H6551_03720 [Chitinophagales bacterium]|nr:hypothetical protein [Chitinophagaceae bacterium]MCB9064231.1 hypothetical protein [Chitinophagales bacterium]
MKKYTFILLSITLAMVSCSVQNKKNELSGKWQAVKLDNPQLDELAAMQMKFLDTFGTHTTPEENMKLYNFTNIDSARASLKQEMDNYFAEQDSVIKNTTFEFKSDGVAYLNFNGDVDTSSWKINDAGKLVLENMKKQNADRVELEIISLSDTELKVVLLGKDRGVNSTVIFKPADK